MEKRLVRSSEIRYERIVVLEERDWRSFGGRETRRSVGRVHRDEDEGCVNGVCACIFVFPLESAFDDVKYTKKNRINEVKVNRTRNKVKSAFVKDYGQTELSGERCFDGNVLRLLETLT